MPARPRPHSILLLVLLAFLPACSGSGDGERGTRLAGSSPSGPSRSRFDNRPPDDIDKPLTAFERQRMLARLRNDPGQLQKLSLRERRELVRMTAGARDDDDED